MRRFPKISLACMVATALAVSAQSQAQDAKPEEVQIQVQELNVDFTPLSGVLTFVNDEGAAPEYWIGVSLEPFLNDVVKSQLNIDHGLSINTVYPDSPAQKAGLKNYDIVVKAGDSVVNEPTDLVKAVGNAKENELSVIVVRSGKEMTVKVVPAKRPKVEAHALTVQAPLGLPAEAHGKAVEHYQKQIQKAMEALKAAGDDKSYEMFFVRPGVVGDVKQRIAARVTAGLPKDVSIQINKDGDQPAKITVKKDGKTFEATEDKLDDLPEDIRGHLQIMLHHPGALQIRSLGQGVKALQGLPGVAAVPALPGVQARVHATPVTPGTTQQKEVRVIRSDDSKKFEELLEEVRQLRKEVKDIKGAK